MTSDATTTRIYRFHQYGGTEMLQLDVVPLPQPGAGEVRVRVQAMSLNRADLLWMANNYVETPELPSRLGYEISGIVEAVGADVTNFQVGDRISSIPAFSIGDYANFGETAILPVRGLMKTPDNFTPAQGAGFAFAYFTGYFALLELAHLQPYQTILITAGTSTTGLAAIAMAKKIGAKVIATTRTSKKRQALLDAGADYVVATEEEDLVTRVMEITNNQGADAIYDAVAGALSDRLAQAVKVRGHWIVYGLLDAENLSTFPWMAAFIRSFHFYVYKVFDFTGNRNLGLLGDEEAFARAKAFIAAGLADGSFPLTIDREFQGLESLPEAMRFMASNQAAGKIVVTL
ncbi:MAG: zinc-dependent alcohol dehydrogenase family protein [Chlorogloeopsis fritschii C42_A2020_084]|uniref:zinc-dependent alcohol dehydrogenase family protein n=1 Tax=Chlorogloeopsis fritschii TaxID=1124 RepID=UPI0019E53020|nr:zinc-dependent alcohol dehydrogenase family protein [Chlorogloeopsis fritschii]MBF2004857.1 zinc-dependent alcohol dehydrogenase family protein [Chlorogloeopsis fritschii C42_A2020_084]